MEYTILQLLQYLLVLLHYTWDGSAHRDMEVERQFDKKQKTTEKQAETKLMHTKMM